MYTIKAIYDGTKFTPIKPLEIEGEHEVIITFLDGDVPDKVKRPISELRGMLKGKVWMADDFNAPLEEMAEYM